jgi:hypothetical protein
MTVPLVVLSQTLLLLPACLPAPQRTTLEVTTQTEGREAAMRAERQAQRTAEREAGLAERAARIRAVPLSAELCRYDEERRPRRLVT